VAVDYGNRSGPPIEKDITDIPAASIPW